VARITGLDRKTVRPGLREIDRAGRAPGDRIRRPGGGRKPEKEVDDFLRSLDKP